MRWFKQLDWGKQPLQSDQWAPLQVDIAAEDLGAVEDAVEELTGFMEYFRAELETGTVTGVSDGQLAVTHTRQSTSFGQNLLQVVFYAAGPVGSATPDAFQRLARAAGSLVDYIQAEGIAVERMTWSEQPYVNRPF